MLVYQYHNQLIARHLGTVSMRSFNVLNYNFFLYWPKKSFHRSLFFTSSAVRV